LEAILTPGVLRSPWVREQIDTFVRRADRLTPINIDGLLLRIDGSVAVANLPHRMAAVGGFAVWLAERAH
jgi:hypothetical protein